MKSPFPGMDPYIEACGKWEDFHKKLIGDIERVLSNSLPERYSVSLAERLIVVLADADGKEESSFQPDLGVTTPVTGRSSKSAAAVAEAEADPEAVPIRAFVATEYQELFIEIYDHLEGERLVTCIEVLSPSNKRRGTPGWDIYQRKRQGLLLGEANFIEIDLVREGGRMPMLDPWPDSPYVILVTRRDRAPLGSRGADYDKPLPVIPVPLLAPDPDVKVALQPLVDDIYARSRYHRFIDYTQPLSPPLAAAPTPAPPGKKRRRR